MKAVVLDKPGSPGELQYRELPMPKVIPSHVLIRVGACAVAPPLLWIASFGQSYRDSPRDLRSRKVSLNLGHPNVQLLLTGNSDRSPHVG